MGGTKLTQQCVWLWPLEKQYLSPNGPISFRTHSDSTQNRSLKTQCSLPDRSNNLKSLPGARLQLIHQVHRARANTQCS